MQRPVGRPSTVSNEEFDIYSFIERNPVNNFEGFSPAEMHRLLYYPFKSEGSPLRLCADIESRKLENSKFFRDIVEYLNLLKESQPMKLTNRGNLPRAFCRELVEKDVLEVDRIRFRNKQIWSEQDSYYISLIDLLMDLTGLTKKRHGAKTLTKRAEKYMDRPLIDLFHYIFRMYATKFNWAYSDLYPDSWIIQGGFGFSIFLIQKYGEEKREPGFYSDKFLKAFPALIREFPGSSYSSPEKQFHNCYSLRNFERFLLRFGLVEVESDIDRYERKCRVSGTELINELIRWSRT